MLINQVEHLGVFDTETTGVDVENDRIVTAYIGVMDRSGALIEKFEWLIDPGIPIPEGAAAVHGVTTEKAQADGVPALAGVTGIVTKLRELVGRGVPIVAFNGRYDMTITDREARRHGIEPLLHFHLIDPFVIDKQQDPYRKGKRKLTDVARHYGYELENAHTADADAIMAGLVAWKLIDDTATKAGLTTLDQLHAAQIAWAREQATGLESYFRRVGKLNDDGTPIVIEKEWPVVFVPNEVVDEELVFV
ncbi:exonuclease domain-containing protein [Curtobacterium sp. MCSS17_016]|uniref:exonuclease domain-containing protein n=1 Tax=Curtobacterium sp. MCSS17_016 TaxID=2175644 RepID=UPI000DA6EC10|nr:exonuclease domain-containing protein [Curtobacterium sp. MCSS17_016]WIE81180.1 exonuclease domain-containing protein [Curtobacterium sp. MCSS17_016]